MKLLSLQRRMARAVMTPLTPSERMRSTAPDGRSMRAVASEIIKPNSRLTSFERLEIYNRQYWFRVLAGLAEDFPGLRAVLVYSAQLGFALGILAAKKTDLDRRAQKPGSRYGSPGMGRY
jgi:hypothetical protein